MNRRVRFLQRRLALRATACAAMATLIAARPASAQAYPSYPVKIVVTFPTGGAPDILARLISANAAIGQPVGTSIHVSGELFRTMTGVQMAHVPYKGRQFAIPDLVGGQIHLMFDNMPSALPMVKEGKLRALGQTGSKRSPAAMDIPTIAEQGLPEFEATSWFALFAPAGTPKEIVAKWNAELRRIFTLPDVAARLQTLGLDAILSSPEELAGFQASEIRKWTKVVKDSGAKAE